MKFSEVPIDTKAIKEMFCETPIVNYLPEIRDDFETFNSKIFGEDIGGEDKVKDLSYYKTELFRSYCIGILSAITNESSLNKKMMQDINS